MLPQRLHARQSFVRLLERRAYATAPPRTLTRQQAQVIKATAPVLQEHGVAIVDLFYKRLLHDHPQLKNFFNLSHQATGVQSAALAHAIWAYASNIENPRALKSAISRVGNKHASLGVTAEMYPVVGEGLLAAIKDVLGGAANESVLDAWNVAYEQLAGYFISFEKELYEKAAATPGGWVGWRKFVISKKIHESDEIISFHVSPLDGGRLPTFTPGQFVSVRCLIPKLDLYQPRQYSLSDVPHGDHFQISVKRELAVGGNPPGKVSNVLHETLAEGAEVEISMPFGDFVLDANATTPVVLISGGVGLTPMMSMLKTVVEKAPSRPVVFVHAARNSRVHAMKDDLLKIRSEHPGVARAIFYEGVSPGDRQGVDFDYQGRIELAKIKGMVMLPDAEFYICGPMPFMKAQSQALEALGVSQDRIRMEVFGAPL